MNIYETPPPAVAVHRPGSDAHLAGNSFASTESISRHHLRGADLVLVRRAGLNELHITIRSEPGDTILKMITRLRALLAEHDGVVARMEVFGAVALQLPFLVAMLQEMGETKWPITWVDSGGLGNCAITGIHVFAVAGVEVKSFRIGTITGCTFRDAFARHCLIGEIIPTRARTSRAEQIRDVLHQMRAAFHTAGMGVHAIARTWFFLAPGTDWHSEFDRAGAEFFPHLGGRHSVKAASTAVFVQNPYGAAVSAAAWAITPPISDMAVHAIASPLQGPIDHGGVSSAAAVEWNTPGHRRIIIPSTGSFGFEGELLHKGDINAQVDLSMEAVEAMLVSRGLDFSDVTRATAFVKLARHAGALEDWFKRQGTRFPAIITRAEFCRDEQLFGLELDAMMQKPAGVRA